MNSGDPLIDEDLKPLLDNKHVTLTEQEDGCNTSGFGVAGKLTSSSPKTPSPLEAAAQAIPLLETTTDGATTAADSMEETKCCRICGEGEEEQDDTNEDDDYYYHRQHYDEESLLGNPMVPTTTLTRQQPPGSGYSQMMIRQHDGSSLENINNDGTTTTAAMQQSHSEDPPITPTTPITTSQAKTKQQRCSNDRKQQKWIQKRNPLIRPCHCKGTMMYVHVSCLSLWRAVSPRSSSSVACDLCGYEYNIYRPSYAAIVTNRYFLRITTMLLVTVAILICAYLCKLVDIYVLGHLPRPHDDDWIQLHGTSSWLWMDRFYLFAGLIVISMLGMVYLAYLCVTRPEEVAFLNTNHASSNGDDNSGLSFFCCDQSSCPWYTCYLADFAACSGDSAAGGFLIFVVLMSLLVISFGVFGAVTGVFRLMESWVDSIAGHIKERILDVD